MILNVKHRFPDAADEAGSNGHVTIGGVRFDNVTMEEAIERIEELVACGVPSLVVTPNVDHLVRLQDDGAYRGIVEEAALVLVDGQPIVWASRLLGRRLKERVAGSDLMPRLCERAAERGYRVFFLGGEDGTAVEASRRLCELYPGLEVAGTHCPPHGFELCANENRRIAEKMRAAGADIVFVGLGSPKQEKWIAEHMGEYGAPVSIGVGIAFSFVAGRVKRAPVAMRRMGLEWLYRLYKEPRRLWRRYLVRGTRFAPIVMREFFGRRRRENGSAGRRDGGTAGRGGRLRIADCEVRIEDSGRGIPVRVGAGSAVGAGHEGAAVE